MKMLLATSNPAKLERLYWILNGLDVTPISPADLGAEPEVAEMEQSLSEIARGKALAWAKHYGLPSLATDGGLVVPALGSRWEPTHTRRAAGPQADDAQRAAHLLGLMRGLDGAERDAYWLEVAALAVPGGVILGQWEVQSRPWRIAESYDPRGLPRGFWVPGLIEAPGGQRFGDLSADEQAHFESHWPTLRESVRATVADLLGKTDQA